MENQQIPQPKSQCQAQGAKSAAKSTKPLELRMLDGFLASRYGALRYATSASSRDMVAICDFRDFTGKPPWQWSEADFVSWCHQELFLNRGLKPSTRRTYQGAIHGFLEYLEKDASVQELVWRQHKVRVRQICPSEISIPRVR
jgi:hypothetical protein